MSGPGWGLMRARHASSRFIQVRRISALRLPTIIEGDYSDPHRDHEDQHADPGSRDGAHLFHGTDGSAEAVAAGTGGARRLVGGPGISAGDHGVPCIAQTHDAFTVPYPGNCMPIRPSATSRRAVAWSGLSGRWWFTATTTPLHEDG